MFASLINFSTVSLQLLFVRYSTMAKFKSSFYFDVNIFIFTLQKYFSMKISTNYLYFLIFKCLNFLY